MKSQQIMIIEHLEPELYPWCIIEYKSISKIIGKSNLWFTNIKKEDKNKLEKYGKVSELSVKELNLKNSCILDPEAPNTLTSEEAKNFSFFIFGGILGDYPPRKRTEVELTKFIRNAEKRNIGKQQFSTDNAVFVVKQILQGKNLKEMKFQNEIEIPTGKYDSVILPYLYPLVKNKPRISKELVLFLKKKKGF
ncbi:hypothetical protein HYW76_01015 [Candidatus Pacearchaeota archaeon]|nr:hypothetical protein [Candidatus Pacearchaeota archaeon]